MQVKNGELFALMDIDDDKRLQNIFQTYALNILAYKYFGDVIIFDNTNLINRYEMFFAPFIGVNGHGESILLGVWLISSEDTETLYVFFETGCNACIVKCQGSLSQIKIE